MDVLSNSFCAGGTVLGNGTWLNVGGNQAITYGGNPMASTQQDGQSPYGNWDGGMAIRFLDPNDQGTANWIDNPAMYMTSRRWYPTLETLEDGSAIILGGCEWGGYVNSGDSQNNPTVEVSLACETELSRSIGHPKAHPSPSTSFSRRCQSTSSPSPGFSPQATSSFKPSSKPRSSTTRTISNTPLPTFPIAYASTLHRQELLSSP